MRFALFLALRYLLRRRTQSLIGLLGIGVGVAVLLTALSLANGFTTGLIRASLKALPHLVLLRLGQTLPPMPEHPLVEAWAPFSATKALLVRRAEPGRGAGVDFATLVGLGKGRGEVYPELGPLPRPGGIVLGAALAQSLSAFFGDELQALSASQTRLSLKVAGRFRTGNYLLDSSYAFTTLEDVEKLLGERGPLGYQVRLKDPWRTKEVAQSLSDRFFVQTWQDTQRTLLEQLALQKEVLSLLLFLIVVVAALGVANVMVLLVVEKTPEIALLRAMGASRVQVAAVFALQGVLLGGAGVLLGNLLGLLLSLYLAQRPVPLPGDLYFLTHLPVEIRPAEWAKLSLLSFLAVVLASSLPLLRAWRIRPGVVLR